MSALRRILFIIGILFAAGALAVFTASSGDMGISVLLAAIAVEVLTLAALLRRERLPAFGNAALVLLGLLLALVMVEAALRLMLPLPPGGGYFIWVPYAQMDFEAAPDALPGIEGIGRFRANNIGLRGSDYHPGAQAYSILTVGGSTTECLYLDQTETWPHLLEASLGRTVWVGNAGRSGHTSLNNVLTIEYLLPQHSGIDAVTVMAGINDANAVMNFGDALDVTFYLAPHAHLDYHLPRTFDFIPPASGLYVWQIIKQIGQRPPPLNAGWSEALLTGQWYTQKRGERQHAAYWIDTVPASLGPALNQYETNILTMAGVAAQHDAHIVFLTQPHLYDPNLPAEVLDRLWFGWYSGEPPGGYYTVRVMRRIMEAFNGRLLDVCAEHDLVCIDLAASMNGKPRYMHDDVHFSEAGARRVAELVAVYFQVP